MRHEDWVSKLQDYIDTGIDKPFRYGSNDCCKFAGGAIKAIVGIDILECVDYRKKLKDYKKYKRLGLPDLVFQILADYGFKEIPLLQASRGDVVICNSDNGETVGVCMGAYIFLPGQSGLVATPLLNGTRAWRIE